MYVLYWPKQKYMHVIPEGVVKKKESCIQPVLWKKLFITFFVLADVIQLFWNKLSGSSPQLGEVKG